jgi:ketosteroid isomerase-like protein
MRVIRITTTLAALLLCLLGLASCGEKMSEEDRVRAVIQDMADAAEAKDARRIKDHISPDYSDPHGMDYQEIKGFIAIQMMQSMHISVFIRKTEVEIKADKAYATVKAIIARGDKPAANEEDTDTQRSGFIFDLTFRKTGGEWMMTEAIHRQVPIMEAI